MKYHSKNIVIIIPTSGNSLTINKVIKSIISQKNKPGQVIVVSSKKIKIKLYKNFFFIYSKIKNQVFQRNLAKNYIKKNIKIILQLDDYVMLEKNALHELINDWNSSDKNVEGIGLFPSNYEPLKPNLIKRILDKNFLKPGKVLKSGYVTAWGKNFFTESPEWLNGGSTSWKLNKNFFSRNYPITKWSVAEDLIFSYKKKNFNLKLSKKSKVKYLQRVNSVNMYESFQRGYFFSKIIKNFVIYNRKLSLMDFYLSTFCLSLSGILINLLKLNFNKSLYHLGRFLSLWLKTFNYKIK